MKILKGGNDDGLYVFCSSSLEVMMKKIRLTITELADVTGIHRQTVSKRLQDIPPESGSSCKRKYYDLKLALAAIFFNGEIQNAK
ncbi:MULTISPECIES: helix-turn-helix domain-containing protein [Klebsiella]|jgi:transcriptional regulator with XRE-family HTH domain|uniref:helix-turn-helix domain-containing protein n=1 Tax=Klebsiella TaxID=570 RepID=UPI000E34098B|nr:MULTISPECIES: helix-turn-helix domain-containing protein [Klebsiella]RSW48121.1 DUF1441 family protein [Klebsiella aerogenes]HDT6555496.1 DUF1441 family protein [Raoultella ornithinolytica]HDZ1151484.1 DUF1441 family protein [Klebsiella pneumoniae]